MPILHIMRVRVMLNSSQLIKLTNSLLRGFRMQQILGQHLEAVLGSQGMKCVSRPVMHCVILLTWRGFETFFCLANHLKLLVWAHHHLSLMTIYQYTSQTLNVSPLEVMIVIFTCSHDMETWDCRKRCQWDYAPVRNLSYSERWQPCYSLASANHIDQ